MIEFLLVVACIFAGLWLLQVTLCIGLWTYITIDSAMENASPLQFIVDAAKFFYIYVKVVVIWALILVPIYWITL